MRHIMCWMFGHHNVRTLGLLPGWPDEYICLRCFTRKDLPESTDDRVSVGKAALTKSTGWGFIKLPGEDERLAEAEASARRVYNKLDPAEWCPDCEHLWDHHDGEGCFNSDPGAGFRCDCKTPHPESLSWDPPSKGEDNG